MGDWIKFQAKEKHHIFYANIGFPFNFQRHHFSWRTLLGFCLFSVCLRSNMKEMFWRNFLTNLFEFLSGITKKIFPFFFLSLSSKTARNGKFYIFKSSEYHFKFPKKKNFSCLDFGENGPFSFDYQLRSSRSLLLESESSANRSRLKCDQNNPNKWITNKIQAGEFPKGNQKSLLSW